jgi:O-methyltransferase
VATERTAMTDALATWLDGVSRPTDPKLVELYETHRDHPLSVMMTHPDVGRLLATLVQVTGGTRVLEVGTFVGVSATWMAASLAPGGLLETLEVDDANADLAERWFRRAGIDHLVNIRRGDARSTLRRLPESTFDLAYLDADKPSYPDYLRLCLTLVRPGGIIVADNVFLDGAMAGDPADDDDRTGGMRRFIDEITANPRLSTSVLSVADGVSVSVVVE